MSLIMNLKKEKIRKW